MSSFLLHQRNDGIPVGVFTEEDYFYLPSEKQHEEYGVAVVESRGPDTEWADWLDQLASKSPSPRAMWDVYESEESDLETVLQEARSNMVSNG